MYDVSVGFNKNTLANWAVPFETQVSETRMNDEREAPSLPNFDILALGALLTS
jgi:hypothetical protein